MKLNVGKIDRIIRIVAGVLLIGNVFVGFTSPIGWLGVILVATGLIGFCPVYLPLKINTRSAGEKLGLG